MFFCIFLLFLKFNVLEAQLDYIYIHVDTVQLFTVELYVIEVKLEAQYFDFFLMIFWWTLEIESFDEHFSEP